MSGRSGPKLAGIGRSGDSDIVLCMDAHDAGSYPGEPTTNYISSVTGWPGSAGVGYATPFTLGEFGQLRNLAPIFEAYGLVPYTLSMDVKTNIPGGVYVYMQNGSYTKYSFIAESITCTTEYQRFTFSNRTPAGPTSAWLANTPTDDRAMLAMYTGYGTGINPTIKNIQLELGAYETPFVVPRLADPYAQGYSARPVSVNLMIHGSVGSGSSFEDSSPSKHTITANNVGSGDDPVHSGLSKISGGSIYFNGEDYWGVKGSYLSIPDSTDWNFGTGDFTVDFWIRLESLGQLSGGTYRPHQEIIGNYDNTSGWRIDFTYKGTSEDGIWLYGPGGSVRAGNITGWVADTWYHIAVVRDSGKVNIYKDGVLRIAQSWATDVGDSGNPLVMGMDPRANPPTDYPLWGYLDEMRVTKGTALWTQSFTPPTRRNRNAPVVDLSGSNNSSNLFTKDMTDVATYRDGQVIEPIASAVWDFDGTDDYMRGAQPTGQVGSTTAKTYEYWFKMQSFPPQAGILTMGSDDANNYKWQYVYVGANGYLQFLYGDNSGYNIFGGSGQQVVGAANVWTCVSISIDISRAYDDRLKIYKNGEPISVSWNTGGSYPRTAFYDGADLRLYTGVFNYSSPVSGSTFFDGEIGKISIWKTGLSHDQVKQNFNANRGRFGV